MKSSKLAVVGLLALVSNLALADLPAASTSSSNDVSGGVVDSYSRQFGVTLGLNLMSVYGLELHYRPDPRLSVSANFGTIGIGLDSSTSSGGSSRFSSSSSPALRVNAMEYDVRAKWHPFGRSFFLGMALGYQKYSVSTDGSSSSRSRDSSESGSLSFDGIFVSPHLGALWIFDSGFALGIEGGPSFPLSNSLTASARSLSVSVDTPAVFAMPLVSLIKVGYMF